LAGIDAAKILGRAPVIMAFLTEPLLFLFGDVDHHILTARRTRGMLLNQSRAGYLSGTLKAT
jgi:hypothetical protein